MLRLPPRPSLYLTPAPRFLLRGTDKDTKAQVFIGDVRPSLVHDLTPDMDAAHDFGDLRSAEMYGWDSFMETGDDGRKWVIVEWIAGQKRYKVHPIPKTQPPHEDDEA